MGSIKKLSAISPLENCRVAASLDFNLFDTFSFSCWTNSTTHSSSLIQCTDLFCQNFVAK